MGGIDLQPLFSAFKKTFSLYDEVHLGNELMKPECAYGKSDLRFIYFTHTDTETSGCKMLPVISLSMEVSFDSLTGYGQ